MTADVPLEVRPLTRHIGAELRGFKLAAFDQRAFETLHGALLEHHVVSRFTRPTFVYDYPEDTSPLVRAHREIPGVVEKWDLYIDGNEQGTGYSELVDPVIQRDRLVAQSLLKAGGDVEAMQVDEDFLRALEFGMPPSGGVGNGIDRLLMKLPGPKIGGTSPFPAGKPREPRPEVRVHHFGQHRRQDDRTERCPARGPVPALGKQRQRGVGRGGLGHRPGVQPGAAPARGPGPGRGGRPADRPSGRHAAWRARCR